MNKRELRKEIMRKRNELCFSERCMEDELIYNKLVEMELYKEAKSIFIYVSYGSEVDTKKVIEDALKRGKKVYVPKVLVDEKEMIAVQIHSLNNLSVSNYGVLEPKTVDKVGESFDIVIMPGVAFDKKGNRIGYGGGYYDKYLEKQGKDYIKVALAHKVQLMDKIESEKHDIKVNYVVTKEEIIKI